MERFTNLPEEKQEVIIDAAMTTFGTNGYKKASASDIAAAAGISKAMVFHYFGTKKALYLYLIRYCYDLIVTEINDKFDNSITDFFDRIMISSKIKLSVLKKHPATMTFLYSIYFEQDKEVKDDIKEILSHSEDFRDKIAFDGMDTSKFKYGVDPKIVMRILLWMAEGFANQSKNSTAENIDELIEGYYECMNLLRDHLYKTECISKNKPL